MGPFHQRTRAAVTVMMAHTAKETTKKVGVTPAVGSGTSDGRRYALRLSEAELARYRALAERARIEEAALWVTAGIVEGARVADLGCGPGAVLTAMAERVGLRGWVTGVDTDPEAVEAARHAIVTAGLRNAEVRLGDAAASGLGPGSVDVAVLRLVLAHNGPSEQAIVDHAAALVRPGGCVYLVDVDATMNRLRPPHPVVLEMIDHHRVFQAARGNDLQAGLRLGTCSLAPAWMSSTTMVGSPWSPAPQDGGPSLGRLGRRWSPKASSTPPTSPTGARPDRAGPSAGSAHQRHRHLLRHRTPSPVLVLADPAPAATVTASRRGRPPQVVQRSTTKSARLKRWCAAGSVRACGHPC